VQIGFITKQEDIYNFKRFLPEPFVGSSSNYGLGLNIQGYQRELLGLQSWRSVVTRAGVPMVNISFLQPRRGCWEQSTFEGTLAVSHVLCGTVVSHFGVAFFVVVLRVLCAVFIFFAAISVQKK